MFSKDQQLQVLLDIQARMMQERSNGTDSRAGIEHATMDRRYMAGIGIQAQSETRRRYPHAAPRDRCVGIAPGTQASNNGEHTLKVTYADGTSEVRSVSSFRKARNVSARKSTLATVTDNRNSKNRDTLAVINNLAPLGDANH